MSLTKEWETLKKKLQTLKREDEVQMTDNAALKLIASFDEKYIINYIELLEQEDKSKKKSFVGYVVKAIEGDWLKGSKTKSTTNKKKPITDAKKRSLREQFNKEYVLYHKGQTDLLYNSCGLEVEISNYLRVKGDEENFQSILKNVFDKNKRSSEWLDFQNWLLQKNPHIELLSKDDYATKKGFKYF